MYCGIAYGAAIIGAGVQQVGWWCRAASRPRSPPSIWQGDWHIEGPQVSQPDEPAVKQRGNAAKYNCANDSHLQAGRQGDLG